MRALLPLLLLLPLAGCPQLLAGVGPTGPHAVHGSCRGDFGQGETARGFAAFIQATDAFISTANDIDGRLRSICGGLGRDLGMTDSELGGGGTAAVCGQANARLRYEVASLRTARVKLRFETTEPVCRTRVDEYRQCIEKCDTRIVQSGRIEIRCEGGDLRGGCAGECHGSCSATVEGRCEGACEGTCGGSCDGACSGICDGECAARDAQGRCAGACKGTCHGTCSAGCSGKCSGRCVVAAQASCAGECRGGCSVEFREPVCSGRLVPPEVKTECREMCDTIRVSHEECTPGEARLLVDASEAAAAAERAQTIALAVSTRMPEIRALGSRLTDLRDTGEIMVRTSSGFAAGATSLGLAAVACAAQEAAELPRAMDQVSVAFQVSVSFSASVEVR